MKNIIYEPTQLRDEFNLFFTEPISPSYYCSDGVIGVNYKNVRKVNFFEMEF